MSNPSLYPKIDSLLSSLSPVSTPSTVVSHSVDDFQSEDLVQPVDKTAPGAKASASGPYDEVQQLADKAKELNVDPTVLVVQQLIQQLKTPAQQQPQPYVPPQPKRWVDKTVLKAIGELRAGGDIFVFLHRFEYNNMKAFEVPVHDWVIYLSSLLHGPYSEAYYNNITNDITFQTMKILLLTTGGYSFAECINSFLLKYRTNGSKSLFQWFNSWRYKFSVILEHLPFFGDADPADLDAVAQTFATIGVLAGMPTELRETVLNRDYDDTLTFINDCNTVLSHSKHSY